MTVFEEMCETFTRHLMNLPPKDGSWFAFCNSFGVWQATKYEPTYWTRYVDQGDGLYRAEEVLQYEWRHRGPLTDMVEWVPLASVSQMG